jgi:hypothetical protein
LQAVAEFCKNELFLRNFRTMRGRIAEVRGSAEELRKCVGEIVDPASSGQPFDDATTVGGGGTASAQGMVTDLSPLHKMLLKSLDLTDNHVSDLSPLRGMPLKKLIFQRNVAIKDLTPLRGMPLEHLECAHTNVSDLSPLKGMKLMHLSCDETLVTDLCRCGGWPWRR